MKKLIAIAAVALTGAVFAATSTCSTCNTCDTCNTCGTPCGWGYRIKVLLKTTTTKSTVKQVNTCSTCTTCKSACYRKPTTKRYLGYVFGHTGKTTCTACTCNGWDRFNLVLWNYDTKVPVEVRRLDVLQFNRFGESVGSMAEVAVRLINPLFDLQFAGFGNMGTRTDGTPAIKSISGFCAGIIPALCNDNLKDQCGNPIASQAYRSRIWTICGTPLYSATTAAYGKWVMAWDSAIVNRINNGAIKFVPAVAAQGDGEEIEDERAGFEAIAGYIPARFSSAALFFGAIDKTLVEDEDVPYYTATTKAWLNNVELGEASDDEIEEGLFWACDQTLVEAATEEDPS